MIEAAALILSGIALGLTIATIQRQHADRELFEILKPHIANTAAPTTSELAPKSPYPCPRCGSGRMRGHASNEPQGLTCQDCGWVRYFDPYTRKLHSAIRQPTVNTGE